jgi:hypothetical protein
MSRIMMSPLLQRGCIGGRVFLLFSLAASVIEGTGCPRGSRGHIFKSSSVAVFWLRDVVRACEQSQNSVAPFSTWKSQRGMLAMNMYGNRGWSKLQSLCAGCRIPPVFARAVFAVNQFRVGLGPRYLSPVSCHGPIRHNNPISGIAHAFASCRRKGLK